MEQGASFGRIDLEGGGLFERTGRALGVTSFGLNAITLQPRQRLRIHRHAEQEEVYLVLRGTLSLLIEGEERRLGIGDVARVAPAVRRQLANSGEGACVVVALGGAGAHDARDAEAFTGWDETAGRPPQQVPLPDDLPA